MTSVCVPCDWPTYEVLCGQWSVGGQYFRTKCCGVCLREELELRRAAILCHHRDITNSQSWRRSTRAAHAEIGLQLFSLGFDDHGIVCECGASLAYEGEARLRRKSHSSRRVQPRVRLHNVELRSTRLICAKLSVLYHRPQQRDH